MPPVVLIVLQSSLAHGRGAGIAAGFGVAMADGTYAALGHNIAEFYLIS